MNIKKITAAFFVPLVLLQGCTANEPLPEETLEKLEDAVHRMDVQSMLDCYDSDTIQAITSGYQLAFSLLGEVTGEDIDLSAEDLMNIMPLLSQAVLEDDGDIPETAKELDLSVIETRIQGDLATVYFTESAGGESCTSYVDMKKEDNQWKISMNTRQISRDEADEVITK